MVLDGRIPTSDNMRLEIHLLKVRDQSWPAAYHWAAAYSALASAARSSREFVAEANFLSILARSS